MDCNKHIKFLTQEEAFEWKYILTMELGHKTDNYPMKARPIESMLGHRRRRWASINTALVQRLVFAV